MKERKEEVDLLPQHMKKWGIDGSLIQILWCFLAHLCITHRVPTSLIYKFTKSVTGVLGGGGGGRGR
jgi:hypothetical protein